MKNDYLAHLVTDLGKRVAIDEIKLPYFLQGGNIFTFTISMIKLEKEDDFNLQNSSFRINVDCAFGQIIKNWGISWRPIER